jgi:hypothetical protein
MGYLDQLDLSRDVDVVASPPGLDIFLLMAHCNQVRDCSPLIACLDTHDHLM